MFDKMIILENKNAKVTLVKERSTGCCSIMLSNGHETVFKFINEDLHDKLVEEIKYQSIF